MHDHTNYMMLLPNQYSFTYTAGYFGKTVTSVCASPPCFQPCNCRDSHAQAGKQAKRCKKSLKNFTAKDSVMTQQKTPQLK